MKMEDHFKETLQRAVANEPPVLDAWDRFERRAGRSRQRRLLAAIAAGAAIAVASVIVVPRLGTGGGIGLTTQPPSASPTPTPTQSVDPYEGWSTHHDDNGFTFRYPADWRVYVYEANPEVVAPGQLPAAGSGGTTMSVYFALLTEEFDSPEWRRKGFDRSTRPDGRPFVWNERLADGGRTIEYRFDWSSCLNPNGTPGCERTPMTLYVSINAGTEALSDRYGVVAERIVSSLEYLGSPTPAATPR